MHSPHRQTQEGLTCSVGEMTLMLVDVCHGKHRHHCCIVIVFGSLSLVKSDILTALVATAITSVILIDAM